MKNKDKFTLKEAFEVIAKHMQSLVKDELKKSEPTKESEPAFKVGQSVKHKIPADTTGWGKIPEKMAAQKGVVTEHEGPSEHGHRYKVKWTHPDGKIEHDSSLQHHLESDESGKK